MDCNNIQKFIVLAIRMLHIFGALVLIHGTHTTLNITLMQNSVIQHILRMRFMKYSFLAFYWNFHFIVKNVTDWFGRNPICSLVIKNYDVKRFSIKKFFVCLFEMKFTGSRACWGCIMFVPGNTCIIWFKVAHSVRWLFQLESQVGAFSRRCYRFS